MCPERTRLFFLPRGSNLTHVVFLWSCCYCRQLYMATCLLPSLRRSPSLVASWVITSPIWKKESKRAKGEQGQMYCVSKEKWGIGKWGKEAERQWDG